MRELLIRPHSMRERAACMFAGAGALLHYARTRSLWSPPVCASASLCLRLSVPPPLSLRRSLSLFSLCLCRGLCLRLSLPMSAPPSDLRRPPVSLGGVPLTALRLARSNRPHDRAPSSPRRSACGPGSASAGMTGGTPALRATSGFHVWMWAVRVANAARVALVVCRGGSVGGEPCPPARPPRGRCHTRARRRPRLLRAGGRPPLTAPRTCRTRGR